MKEYKVHPAAELFDILEGAEYEALKADIKEHGLKQPIVLWIDPDGCEVLADGRNRYKICGELDIEPKTTTLPKGTDPVAYIMSANVLRRHLTSTQCSAIAASLVTMKLGDNQHTKEGGSNETPSVTMSEAVSKVPGATIGTTKRLIGADKKEPGLLKQARAGKITAGAAEKRVKVSCASKSTGESVSTSSKVPPEEKSNRDRNALSKAWTPVRKLFDEATPAARKEFVGRLACDFGPGTVIEFGGVTYKAPAPSLSGKDAPVIEAADKVLH